MDSPIEVAEAIRPMIEDRVVCDLGSHTGNFAKNLNEYAKKVICMDREKKDLKLCKKKGLETEQGNIYEDKLPKADVYYTYTHVYKLNELMRNIEEGIVILGFPKVRFDMYNDYPGWIDDYPFKIDIPFKPTTQRHDKFKDGEFEEEEPIWRIIILGKFS